MIPWLLVFFEIGAMWFVIDLMIMWGKHHDRKKWKKEIGNSAFRAIVFIVFCILSIWIHDFLYKAHAHMSSYFPKKLTSITMCYHELEEIQTNFSILKKLFQTGKIDRDTFNKRWTNQQAKQDRVEKIMKSGKLPFRDDEEEEKINNAAGEF